MTGGNSFITYPNLKKVGESLKVTLFPKNLRSCPSHSTYLSNSEMMDVIRA